MMKASFWMSLAALVLSSVGAVAAEDQQPNRRIDPNAPMTFTYTGNGGNMKGSDWIAAEGMITADTPKRFTEFMKQHGATDTTVQFNSPGGNLLAALKLGEMIRDAKLDTGIGRTTFREDGQSWSARSPGICISACAYAFLGGVTRFLDKDDRYGVHQFYDAKSLDEPTRKTFSAVDVSLNQVLGGIVLEYVQRMGASPGLVALAGSTPPTEVRFLSEAEAKKLLVDNTGSSDTGWRIEAKGGGAVLTNEVTYVPRPPVHFALFCRAGKGGTFLGISSSMAYLDRWLKEGYGVPQPLSAEEVAGSLDQIELSGRGWKTTLDTKAIVGASIDKNRRFTMLVALSAEVTKAIRKNAITRVRFDFPFQYAGFLISEFQSEVPSEALDLTLKNCIR
ncbi:COG3904 family protein [Azospirillum canadense]|uniref:COG3904 family protein n=1 Tax=Azospirillum canadense TaxID=403962 RepID=UPI002226CE26|nr:hypothetical protein [Azospirillum canadense]MCW2240762.1 hypothetical protein [Azospirillum canadense]